MATQAHLHRGAAETIGPIVAFVFAGPDGFLKVDFNGDLIEGTLTSEDLFSACPADAGVAAHVASLKAAIDKELVYLNVHSEQFPAGVVRGQLQI